MRLTSDAEPRHVLVRLRVYRAGVVRDYHGERFSPGPEPDADPFETAVASVPDGETPRLLVSGRDETPPSEPEPTAAIDRLVALDVEPGVVRDVNVVLHGACAGEMADLFGESTCVGTENQRASATITDARKDGSSFGTFGEQPFCAISPRTGTVEGGAPLFDEEVCVQGGAFLFGGRFDMSDASERSGRPERVAVEPSFLMDKYEVTVGRMRDAMARGFQPARLFATGSLASMRGGECTRSFPTPPRNGRPRRAAAWASEWAFAARVQAERSSHGARGGT